MATVPPPTSVAVFYGTTAFLMHFSLSRAKVAAPWKEDVSFPFRVLSGPVQGLDELVEEAF